ncbi:MAG: hypothetical protein ACE5JT_03845, partial [Nitrosopumilaceae archaeon]
MAKEKPKDPSKKKKGLTAAEVAALAEAAAKAAAAKAAAAKAAVEAEAKAEYEAAAEEAVAPEAGKSFTHRYEQDQIFRREMGEPEFFQYKKDLHPIR